MTASFPPSKAERNDTDARRIERAVIVVAEKGQPVLLTDFSGDMPLALEVFRHERDAAVRMTMAKAVGGVGGKGRWTFESADLAARPLAAVRRRLFEVARKPLSQRQVEAALNISSAERLRWTKDGRLATSGSASMRKGQQKVALVTYAPDLIDALRNRPDVIVAWRAADCSET